jgi:septal ring factor EnvC (AmiA/AmiB activator)
VQVWTLHGLSSTRADLEAVRNELRETRSKLQETRGSLAVVWQATKNLGEDRTERLGVLADSLRSVLARAEGEARLWQASYDNFDQRFADNDKAIRTVTNAMRSMYTRLEGQRSRLDVLERSDRTHTSAIDALSRTR